MSASHFRELEVWQRSMELARCAYRTTASFPKDERFGLVSQPQRAAVSIPSNIAEGNARGSTLDHLRFVSIASGSCAELQTQLVLSNELGVGQAELVAEALALCERVSQMLANLRRSLKQRVEDGSRVPGPGSRISEPAPEDYT